MNLVRVVREVAQELRDLGQWSAPRAELEDLRERLLEAIKDPERAVDLAMCVGSECIRLHGLRVATWRGIGPSSIYSGVCDECHAERLTAEEREHMVELFGASWVRHLGLHRLHLGRLPTDDFEEMPDDAR